MSLQLVTSCIEFNVKSANRKILFSVTLILLLFVLLNMNSNSFSHSFSMTERQLIPVTSLQDKMEITVLSDQNIHGIAGQTIKIEGSIASLDHFFSNKNNGSGIAYISIVDVKDRVPVDLEDWSAEKGLYISSIKPGHPLPLEWNVRLVKSGMYSISVLFNRDDDHFSNPITSQRITLEVSPKQNLNPNNVLPVAFGVPICLIIAFGVMNFLRGRKTGIYA